MKATVEAQNVIGYSVPNTPNTSGATVQTVPQAPASAPTNVVAGTTSSTIQVTIATLSAPENGGSTLLSLNLQYDAGTSGVTWTDLYGVASDTLTTTFTVTGLTAGSSY